MFGFLLHLNNKANSSVTILIMYMCMYYYEYTIAKHILKKPQNPNNYAPKKGYTNNCCVAQNFISTECNSQIQFQISITAVVLDGRKEMFYLTMRSTHFYLRLYGVRHMVKNHSDRERGKQLPPHRLLFSISSKGSFICIIPQTG